MSEPLHKRAQRVGELIQHELANVITHELKDPRVGFVTVTEVRVTSDLKSARVFVSVYGSPEERTASLEGLRKAGGYLKCVLGERLELRWIPELSFEADETLDRAERLESIINAIAKGETEAPPLDSPPVVEVSTFRRELAQKRRSSTEREGTKVARPHRRPRR